MKVSRCNLFYAIACGLLAAGCAQEASVIAAVFWGLTGGVCLAKAFGAAQRE